jgi:hypothetical protein
MKSIHKLMTSSTQKIDVAFIIALIEFSRFRCRSLIGTSLRKVNNDSWCKGNILVIHRRRSNAQEALFSMSARSWKSALDLDFLQIIHHQIITNSLRAIIQKIFWSLTFLLHRGATGEGQIWPSRILELTRGHREICNKIINFYCSSLR